MITEKLKYRFIIKTLVGALLGLLIWVILFMCGAYTDEMVLDRSALMIQLAGSLLLDALNMGGAVIYEIESLGIWKPTLIHYILSMSSLTAASLILGWFDRGMLVIMLLVCTVIYFIIWLVNHLFYKHSIRTMNRDLELMMKKSRTVTAHETYGGYRSGHR